MSLDLDLSPAQELNLTLDDSATPVSSLAANFVPVKELSIEFGDVAGNEFVVNFLPFYKGDKGDKGDDGVLTPADRAFLDNALNTASQLEDGLESATQRAARLEALAASMASQLSSAEQRISQTLHDAGKLITDFTGMDVTPGSAPVYFGDALPALPGALYPKGSIFVLNGKVYVSRGDHWSSDLDAMDIQGRILDSQINETLLSRISLVDAPEEVAGSVAYRLAAEAKERAEAVAAEARARAEALAAEAASRAAAILDEASSRTKAISDEAAARAAAIDAEARDRANAVADEASKRGAAISQESSRAQSAESSLSSLITSLTASLNGLSAGLQTEQTARANADSAEALSRQTLAARLDPSGDVGKALATAQSAADAAVAADKATASRVDTVQADLGTTKASLSSETSARVGADSALSSRLDTATASIASNSAAVSAESKARVDADSALSSRIDSVSATAGSTSAALTSESKARADADAALSSRIDTVVASSAANASAISTEQTARANADSAEASARQSLAARLDASGDIGKAIATAQYTANSAVSANGATSGRVDTLSSSLGTTNSNLQTEQTTRANADSALSSRIDTLTSSVASNTASITAEQTTRAAADSANASAISTVQASLSGGGNLLANPGLELDLSGWLVDWTQKESDSRPDLMLNGVDEGWLPHGEHVLTLHRPGAPSGVQQVRNAVEVAVQAGQRLCASALFACHRASVNLAIIWYDKDYGYIAPEADSPCTSETATPALRLAGYKQLVAFGTAPTGAAFARFKFTVSGTEGFPSTNDAYVMMFRPMLEFAVAGQTQPSPWTPSAAGIRADVNASLVSEATARTTADSALSSRIDTLTSTVAGNTAAISSEASTRASAVSAVSSRVDAVVSDYKAADGATLSSAQSYVQGYSYSKTEANNAIATSVSNVSARLNDGGDIKNALVQVQATANTTAAAVSGTWGVTLDVNGRVTGMKYYSDGRTAEFKISADKVLLGDYGNYCSNGCGASNDGWTNGVAQDFPWSDWISGNSGKRAFRFCRRDSEYGNWFDVKPGDKFFCGFDSLAGGGKTSPYTVSVGLHLQDGACNNHNWTAAAQRPTSASGGYSAKGMLEIPSGFSKARVWVQIDGPSYDEFPETGGVCYVANIVVRRMNGAELIVDGAVTANKINVTSLSALTSMMGVLSINDWLYLEGGSGAGSFGGIRTAGKTWAGDGVDGFAMYRSSSSGSTYFEVKAGSNTLHMINDKTNNRSICGINWSGNFIVDNAGCVTANNIKARGDIEATTLKADTVMVGSGHLVAEAAAAARSTFKAADQSCSAGGWVPVLNVITPYAGLTTTTVIVTISGTTGSDAIAPTFRLTDGAMTRWSPPDPIVFGTNFTISFTGTLTGGAMGVCIVEAMKTNGNDYTIKAGSSIVVINTR